MNWLLITHCRRILGRHRFTLEVGSRGLVLKDEAGNLKSATCRPTDAPQMAGGALQDLLDDALGQPWRPRSTTLARLAVCRRVARGRRSITPRCGKVVY